MFLKAQKVAKHNKTMLTTYMLCDWYPRPYFIRLFSSKYCLRHISLLSTKLVGHQLQQCKLNGMLAGNLFLLSNIYLCWAGFCAYRLYEIGTCSFLLSGQLVSNNFCLSSSMKLGHGQKLALLTISVCFVCTTFVTNQARSLRNPPTLRPSMLQCRVVVDRGQMWQSQWLLDPGEGGGMWTKCKENQDLGIKTGK